MLNKKSSVSFLKQYKIFGFSRINKFGIFDHDHRNKIPVTREKVEQAIKQLAQTSGKKGLRSHFGKLKRGIDGLDYQKQVRNDCV